MGRLLLIAVVCCALLPGCGKSGEGEAGAPPANSGGSGAPAAGANTADLSGDPQAGTSSNPLTRFFTGIDRAAKRTGTGVPR